MKIEKMLAFVAIDPKDNTEGVVAFLDRDTQKWMPLVGADMRRMNDYKHMAQHISNESGRTIQLLEFTQREVKEIITPKKRVTA